MKTIPTVIASILLLPIGAGAAEKKTVLEVSAGEHDRKDTPVLFHFPESPAGRGEEFALVREEDGAAVAVQRFGKQGTGFAWLLEKPLPAGETRRYVLTPRPSKDSESSNATCANDGRHLVLSAAGRPVLRYHHAVAEPPEGMESHYRRSGHIHPLFSPSGREITGDFPVDHPHQHGIFFPWRKTTFEGRHPEFWNQAAEAGRIEHVETGRMIDGPVFAQFTVQLRHSDLTAPEGPVPVLDEIWTVRAYNLGDYFLVDLVSKQSCASDSPLAIDEYHYGGMAIRGNAQWLDDDRASRIKELTKRNAGPEELAKVPMRRDYLTSEGKTWFDGNATRARWVEMHGDIDGAPAGVTIFCHPKNFRSPQPVRLHPTKPYFCFAPMALGDFKITPEKELVSRYRFYVHDGPVDAAMSERLWNDYASPPEVRVVSP